jgi:hypothetical protein
MAQKMLFRFLSVSPKSSMRPVHLAFAVLLTLAPAASRAQMVLPGAVTAPTPVGQTAAPPSAPRPRAAVSDPDAYDRHFTPSKPPAIESVLGKTLSLAGARGAVVVEKTGADLHLSRLVLTGDKISQPNQNCEVAMGADEPLKLKSLGAPDGVQRLELDSTACPLQFDVLSGALRAVTPSGSCSFAQADCRVEATGLWGPSGSSFGEGEAKTIEHDRTALENSVRAHSRSLLAKYKQDKAATHATVMEQAGFSASRAQTCRDYDREEKHGFCALRMTEARDFRLQARLAGETPGRQEKKPARTTKAAAKPARPPQGPALPPAPAVDPPAATAQ